MRVQASIRNLPAVGGSVSRGFLAAGLVLITLVVVSSLASVALASDSNASSSSAGIPIGLLTYFDSVPGTLACASGTISPFTVNQTTCSPGDFPVGQTLSGSNNIDCSSACQSSVYNTASSNFAQWQAAGTVPSTNPSNTYYNPTVAFYWIGLENNLPGGCSGTCYLLQSGLEYGASSTYDSHHPVMFVEFFETSGPCSSFCGYVSPVSPGDSMTYQISFVGANFNYWTVYAGDNTKGTYVSDKITYGTASGEIPYNSLQYALQAVEGHGTTSSSYFPSAQTFSAVIGGTPSGTYQLGTASQSAGPSGTKPTVSYNYYTYSCTIAGSSQTCGDNTFTVS